MIEESGTIIEIRDGGVAVVQCCRNSACHHCPSAAACHLGDDRQTMLVEALNVAGGQLHDEVKVVTSTRNFLQSSFMLYIIPVLGLIAGAILGQMLGENLAARIDPSLLSALLGLLGLILAFVGVRALTRSWRREHYMPRIIAIQKPAICESGN